MKENELNEVENQVVEEIQEEKKSATPVDLTKINIVKNGPIEREKDLQKAIYGGRASHQIVAAQSGYMAQVTSLVHKDVINLLYSNLSRYEYRKSVYKVIYDKINAISSGAMSFEEWLKNTSAEDVETFYYGLYCATFPDEGTFVFECPYCHEERTIKINHGSLIRTTDRDNMKKLIKKISTEALNDDARKKLSLIGKVKGLALSESKIIMVLRTPTLWDSLEILRTVPEAVIDRDQLSITNMLYIEKFLVPTSNGDSYIEVTDGEEILNIIDNMSISDAQELQNAVSDKVDENRITYSIKNLKCSSCKKDIEEQPVSIEDILFTLIFEKTQ